MRETGFVFGDFCAFLLKRQEKPCKGGMTAGWWSVVGCVWAWDSMFFGVRFLQCPADFGTVVAYDGE
jgi:hypothetical protein